MFQVSGNDKVKLLVMMSQMCNFPKSASHFFLSTCKVLSQEATVRTGHGTTDWFQIEKGVRQGCIVPLLI